MSLDYYLNCRRRYNNIIICLEEIVNNHELIFFETLKLDTELSDIIFDKLNLLQDRENLEDKLKYVKNLKNICEVKIHELCNHEFVNDLIDISPDKSQTITYCKICDYTK